MAYNEKRLSADAIDKGQVVENNGDSIEKKFHTDVLSMRQVVENDDESIDRKSKIDAQINSDNDYRKTVGEIVNITKTQLESIGDSKRKFQLRSFVYICILLTLQFALLAVILLFNDLWDLGVAPTIIQVFIVSVFVETLAGLMIMIRFSFASKEEIELISILSTISERYQKF